MKPEVLIELAVRHGHSEFVTAVRDVRSALEESVFTISDLLSEMEVKLLSNKGLLVSSSVSLR